MTVKATADFTANNGTIVKTGDMVNLEGAELQSRIDNGQVAGQAGPLIAGTFSGSRTGNESFSERGPGSFRGRSGQVSGGANVKLETILVMAKEDFETDDGTVVREGDVIELSNVELQARLGFGQVTKDLTWNTTIPPRGKADEVRRRSSATRPVRFDRDAEGRIIAAPVRSGYVGGRVVDPVSGRIVESTITSDNPGRTTTPFTPAPPTRMSETTVRKVKAVINFKADDGTDVVAGGVVELRGAELQSRLASGQVA